MGYRKFFASICNERGKTLLIRVWASSEMEARNLVSEQYPTVDIIKVSVPNLFFRTRLQEESPQP